MRGLTVHPSWVLALQMLSEQRVDGQHELLYMCAVRFGPVCTCNQGKASVVMQPGNRNQAPSALLAQICCMSMAASMQAHKDIKCVLTYDGIQDADGAVRA